MNERFCCLNSTIQVQFSSLPYGASRIASLHTVAHTVGQQPFKQPAIVRAVRV